MEKAIIQTSDEDSVPVVGQRRSVLVVDDSRSQRRILSAYLSKWGYEVLEAESGLDAMTICQSRQIDMVVSDWMMPGMNGLDFCKAFRALKRDSYGYFILLTSKSEKGEVAQGLDVGADDFLAKPIAAGEFRARLRAGERILGMEHELSEKNRLMNEALGEINGLYDALDRDLIEARGLQQSLVRERFRDFGSAKVSLLLRPCGHVGGDLVGFFPISKSMIGLFSIDVSGHGIASAMITARMASYFSGSTADQNIGLMCDENGKISARSASLVAARLNDILLSEMHTEHYLTMGLAVLNTQTGEMVMAQCGHPYSVIQRAAGKIELSGTGGLPIGLIPGAEWVDHTITLAPGDRILIASDGISECPDRNGNLLGDEGVIKLMRRNAHLSGNAFFETIMWDLTSFAGDKPFPDDISAVLLEYQGPSEAQ